eukprot:scaffold129849_cov28-Tisochrysis_lutea.AAC.1
MVEARMSRHGIASIPHQNVDVPLDVDAWPPALIARGWLTSISCTRIRVAQERVRGQGAHCSPRQGPHSFLPNCKWPSTPSVAHQATTTAMNRMLIWGERPRAGAQVRRSAGAHLKHTTANDEGRLALAVPRHAFAHAAQPSPTVEARSDHP